MLTRSPVLYLHFAAPTVGHPFFLFSASLSLLSSFVNLSPPSLHQDEGSRLWVEGVGCVGKAMGASAGLLSRQGEDGTGWQPGGKALLDTLLGIGLSQRLAQTTCAHTSVYTHTLQDDW